jgi:hypothetical protein
LSTPPPKPEVVTSRKNVVSVVLPLIVLPVTVKVPALWMPPPAPPVSLLLIVVLRMVAVPVL